MTKKHAEYLVIIFFLMVIGIVFQQIATSMTEQGIASGTPYDNAAAYPRAVAILAGALLFVAGLNTWRERKIPTPVSISQMRRPAGLIVIFSIYLLGLGTLGYHLSTTPMLMSLLWVAGYTRLVWALIYSVCLSFGAAFLFEVFLNIVLPGGILRLNIAW